MDYHHLRVLLFYLFGSHIASLALAQWQRGNGILPLNSDEQNANQIFMSAKRAELASNISGLHFLRAKTHIDQSKVFKYLSNMPKGGVLHMHLWGGGLPNYIITNISYMQGLQLCVNKKKVSVLSFRFMSGSIHNCKTFYQKVQEMRANYRNDIKFNKMLEETISLKGVSTTTPYNQMRILMSNILMATNDLYNYKPIFRAYCFRVFNDLFYDRIIYAELRVESKMMYEYKEMPNNFMKLTLAELESLPRQERGAFMLELYKVNKLYKQQNQWFLGVKIIITLKRIDTRKDMLTDFNEFLYWHNKYPDFFIGFDFSGPEEIKINTETLKYMLSKLPSTANFYFHQRETRLLRNESMIDRILAKTKRIGQSSDLYTSPKIMKIMRQRNIAVEACPISYQIHKNRLDMRTHPSAVLLTQNIPIVICNDYPALWNAYGISYDYYYTIMGMASRTAGLDLLKQLVFNSLIYSKLTKSEYNTAFNYLKQKWEKFIRKIIERQIG